MEPKYCCDLAVFPVRFHLIMPIQFYNSHNWNQSLSLNAGFGVLSWRRGQWTLIPIFILPHLESFFLELTKNPGTPKKIWIRYGHLNYNITFVQNNVTEVSIHLTFCCDQISLANFPHLVTKWTIVLHQICYTKYYEKYSQIKKKAEKVLMWQLTNYCRTWHYL